MTSSSRTMRELLQAAIADMERLSRERHQLDDRGEVLIGETQGADVGGAGRVAKGSSSRPLEEEE